MLYVFFFLRSRRPPRSTRTDTLFPYTTLFRSRAFGSVAEALQAYENGDITLHARISLRDTTDGTEATRREGTMGRFLFDECLPPGFGYITETVKKKQMGEIVDRLANEFPKAVVAASLDAIDRKSTRLNSSH